MKAELPRLVAATLMGVLLLGGGCDGGSKVLSRVFGGGKPDELPVMLNKEPPFRYPAALYSARVQGNVSLRLFIDEQGALHPESTLVAESSGNHSLDSAAVAASAELSFAPARRKGKPLAVTIIYPVYFRHPEGSSLPGDSILRHGTKQRDTL